MSKMENVIVGDRIYKMYVDIVMSEEGMVLQQLQGQGIDSYS